MDPTQSAGSANASSIIAGSNQSSPEAMMAQGVKSFQELERVAPQVAHAMMQAIAQTIMQQMQDSQTRIHQMNQQAAPYS